MATSTLGSEKKLQLSTKIFQSGKCSPQIAKKSLIKGYSGRFKGYVSWCSGSKVLFRRHLSFFCRVLGFVGQRGFTTLLARKPQNWWGNYFSSILHMFLLICPWSSEICNLCVLTMAQQNHYLALGGDDICKTRNKIHNWPPGESMKQNFPHLPKGPTIEKGQSWLTDLQPQLRDTWLSFYVYASILYPHV